jgi:hypothetical protein
LRQLLLAVAVAALRPTVLAAHLGLAQEVAAVVWRIETHILLLREHLILWWLERKVA